MIDLGIAIDYFAKKITVVRKTIGDYNAAGDYVPGTPVTGSINGTVQPLRSNDLLDMPEGIRNEAALIISTRDSLNNDDSVIHDGNTYRVIYTWPSTTTHYWRYAIGLTNDA